MDGSKRGLSATQVIFLIVVATGINVAVLYLWDGRAPSTTKGARVNGSNRYQLINTGTASAFRLNKETGEVLFFLLDQRGRKLDVFSTTEKRTIENVKTEGTFEPSPLVDYVALGLDPVTGKVVDWERYNQARQERGLEPVVLNNNQTTQTALE